MTGWRKRQVIEMAERASPSKQDWWKDDDALERFAELVREEVLAQTKQKRPQNCGTGYCSCIECVMEPHTTTGLTHD